MPLSFQRSILDSTRFGLEVFTARGLTLGEVPELAERARSQACDLVIARIDATEVRLLHALEARGFRVMDTLVHSSRDISAADEQLDVSGTRTFTAADIASIEDIAARAFVGFTGHYHNDDRLPRAACDEIYRDWAARSCRDRSVAEGVVVSGPAGAVSGFITIRRSGADSFELGLGAIDAARRGAGLWVLLIRGTIRWAQVAGARQIAAPAHITNLRSQLGLIRAGFLPQSYTHTLHWWPQRD